MLLIEVECIRYLLRQGLALRGHVDDDGNFTQLLKLREVVVNDFSSWIKEGNYLSHDILHELCQIISLSIVRELVQEMETITLKPDGALKPIPPPQGVWETLAMDFLTITPTSKTGNKYVIIITDLLSKFVIAKPARDETSIANIKLHCQTQIEVTGMYNCQKQFRHRTTLVMQQQKLEPHEYVKQLHQYISQAKQMAQQNIEQQQQRAKSRYDQNRRNPSYDIGDYVCVARIGMRSKLAPKKDGPYRITQKLGQLSYMVQDPRNLSDVKQVHVQRLRPYYQPL
ncbi:unnamed protein product [Didymodactylos carnosus]|uniref:Integrase p58-like C-terminal domain-containing protein n=1 Tax=Didymodactylos carnosus TaxID=1234261 RepID=A0A8S2ER78_9BILA|nr:unnamed protein product [Didymodactylos carnosus]CAF4089189.1 unnamed protein product [Didymodactylos carnosus]